MANHASGDWRHLPHDPQAFFGLDGDFDRKQLKRAYGALIRQFKPETHPNEFQRIRQAYEQLDSRSRYGVEQKFAAQQTAAWQAIVAAEIAEAQAAAQASGGQAGQRSPAIPRQRTTPRPSVTQAAIDSPLETYQRLEQQAARSPQEYYVLAVLSDLLPSKGKAGFLSWLLAGMKAHPRDPGLLALLAEHLRSDIPLERAPAVLLAVAGVVASDSFYRVTEPLWERLLRTRPFAEFYNALRQCEQRVKQIDSRPRIVFYLRMLRPALWKGDSKWVDRAIAMVEKHGAELDSASEMDLEFILMVRAYQREDRVRIGNRDARRQLDDMIRSYCTSDWRAAAAAVATVQDSLARDSHGVIAAFPMEAALEDEAGMESDRRLLTICLIIAADVAEQTGADFDQGSESKSQTQAAAALRDLGESLAAIGVQINWLERRMYWLTLAGMIAPPVLLVGMMPVMVLSIVWLFWAMVAALVFFLLLKPKYLDPRVNEGRLRIVRRAYEDTWRPRLFRYVQSCGHTGAALQRLLATSQVEAADNWMSVVLSYAEVDPGLLIFGRAQAFAT